MKALHQQALATQKSIAQLQAHEAASSYGLVWSDLPAVPKVDGSLLGVAGVAGALMLAVPILWWSLWRRPQARTQGNQQATQASITPNSELGQFFTPEEAPAQVEPSTRPPAMPQNLPEWSPSRAWSEPVQGDVQTSPFAPPDTAMGFDPEVAAGEVVRVRKSLADKRDARAQLLEREKEQYAFSPLPAVDAYRFSPPEPQAELTAELDLDLDLDLDLHDSPDAAPEALEVEPLHHGIQDPGQHALDGSMPEPEPEPTPEPGPAPESAMEHDYAVTLELAQESETLDLWPEARELANEALESSDMTTTSGAHALLAKLDRLESDRAEALLAFDSAP